uniref:Amino acid ABC transporter, periplasmic amino acid-binding protein n=1 Tax=Rheinheimera sp. BAL341 TaxID=1708203 RepID=A0A486XVN1_9GAMM
MKTLQLVVISFIVCLTSCKPAVQQVSSTASAANSAEQQQMCSFTMGIDAWEPYQYMTVGNVVAGLDVELVQNIMTDMGCTLDVVQGSWLELLTLLREGEVDFVLGASKTAERESFAYFSEPYRQERFQLYVRAEQVNLPYSDLRAFVGAGLKVGVVNEYFYGGEVAELYEDDMLRPMFVGAIISELNMARLLDEEIDGLLEDSFVGASILRRKGLDKHIQPHSISLGASDVYVMFSQGSVSAAQVEQFNAGLVKLRDSGRYNQIVDKYRH